MLVLGEKSLFSRKRPVKQEKFQTVFFTEKRSFVSKSVALRTIKHGFTENDISRRKNTRDKILSATLPFYEAVEQLCELNVAA